MKTTPKEKTIIKLMEMVIDTLSTDVTIYPSHILNV